jgi:hypothetical protein
MRRTKPHHPDPIEPNRPERIETGTPATFLQCQQPLEEWRLESNGNGEQSSRRVCRLRQSAFIKMGCTDLSFLLLLAWLLLAGLLSGLLLAELLLLFLLFYEMRASWS